MPETIWSWPHAVLTDLLNPLPAENTTCNHSLLSSLQALAESQLVPEAAGP